MAGTGGLTAAQSAVVEAVAAQLPPGPVVVALSGGADSAALAWALARLGAPARAVSVDHGLPGSARLMEAAGAIAAALGMPHVRIDARAEGTSETVLREARLATLAEAAEPGETILTAHTADDQAETVLGNLVRGAGSGGLAGIPRRRGPFARPLLGITRGQARRAAAEAGLPFVDDPENFDPTVRRNRLRSITIPHLAEYNPEVRAALARAGDLLAADDRLLEERAALVPVYREEEAVLVPAAALVTLPGPVAARVVRRALRLVSGQYAGEASDVAAVMRAADTGSTAQLSGGHLATRERALIAIHPPSSAAAPDAVDLVPTGATRFGPWTIGPAGPGPMVGRWRARVPVAERMQVRVPTPGDRIHIGGGRHKTVADALGEAAVPVRLRSRWPLVVGDDTIGWIVGVRAAAGGDTTMALAARKERV